jgi:uncharacterized protein (TIGR02391 family)
MDLKSLIRPQLWNEISNAYLAENYRTSILDAMRYLSQVIREKSGLDGDGTSLVGQAFGGDEPKLRLNRLQTQSEKDEQRGFQLTISGLYSAIRNPRTHEGMQDTKNTADPIIYFINYVLNVIDKAKPPFVIDDFLLRVFDEGFVAKQIYVTELVKEIPRNKYLETLIEIYRRKSTKYARALEYVFPEILSHLNQAEIKEFLEVVSTELDIVNDENIITLILRIVPSKYWSMVKLTAKLRIENKLITSVNFGTSKPGKIDTRGALGTWATRIIDHFTLREELLKTISSNLKAESYEYNRYILQFFLKYLPNLYEDPNKHKYFVTAMKNVIRYKDTFIKNLIQDFLITCPEDWQRMILEGFKEWTDEESPEFYLPDGTPFLGKVPYTDYEEPAEDEFPF